LTKTDQEKANKRLKTVKIPTYVGPLPAKMMTENKFDTTHQCIKVRTTILSNRHFPIKNSQIESHVYGKTTIYVAFIRTVIQPEFLHEQLYKSSIVKLQQQQAIFSDDVVSSIHVFSISVEHASS
jgi:hypothetical protein